MKSSDYMAGSQERGRRTKQARSKARRLREGRVRASFSTACPRTFEHRTSSLVHTGHTILHSSRRQPPVPKHTNGYPPCTAQKLADPPLYPNLAHSCQDTYLDTILSFLFSRSR